MLGRRSNHAWVFLLVFLGICGALVLVLVRELSRGGAQGGRPGAAGPASAGEIASGDPLAREAVPLAGVAASAGVPGGEGAASSPDGGEDPMLQGRVLGPAGPIPGATVTLYPADLVVRTLLRLEERLTTEALDNLRGVVARVLGEIEGLAATGIARRTDAEGRFRFRLLPEGAYFSLALAPGHVFRVGKALPVRRGESREIEIRLDAGAVLAGRVLEGGGQGGGGGVAGVRLTAVYRAAGLAGIGRIVRRLLGYVNGEFLRGPLVAVSGPGGDFRFDSLPPGTYDLVATAEGRTPASAEGVRTGDLGVLVLLGEGAEVTGRLVEKEGGGAAAGIAVSLAPVGELESVPLPGAGLLLSAASEFLGDEPPMETVSQEDGSFRFDRVPEGRYRARVAARGFVPVERSVTAEPGARVDLGVVELDRGGTIYGRVQGEEGRPVAGALVTALPAGGGMRGGGGGGAQGLFLDELSGRTQVRTGEDGRFEIGGLAPRAYNLVARASGFAIATARGIEPGAGTTLTMEPGWRLEGLVTRGDDGTPVAGARVTAGGVTAVTGEDGSFVLEGVVPGESFALLAARFGQTPDARWVRVVARRDDLVTERVRVGRDEREGPVRIEMWARTEIRGVVRLPDGGPAGGAVVQVVPGGDLPEFASTLLFFDAGITDEEGAFVVTGGGMGGNERVRVRATYPGCAPGLSDPFSLAREGGNDVVVVLQEGAAVEGHVTDGERPLEGVKVRLGHASTGSGPAPRILRLLGVPPGGSVVYTDREGVFLFDQVAPGSYELEAGGGRFADTATVPLEVAAGDRVARDLVLDPGGVIEGFVRDAGDRPVPGALVRVVRESSGQARALPAYLVDSVLAVCSDQAGGFRATGIPSGAYTVRAECEGYVPAEVEGIAPGAGPVEIVLVREAVVRGTVVDGRGGGAIYEFQVRLRPRDAAGTWRSVEDAAGRFEFDEVVPGSYLVSARARGYARAEVTVTVASGEEEEVRFELGESGVIRGRVVESRSGRPVRRARVRVVSQGEEGGAGGENASPWAAYGESVFTDRDGAFELRDIPEFEQVVVVDHQEFVQGRKTLHVPPGGSAEVTIRLDEGLVVAGTAREPGGGAAASRFLFLTGGGGVLKTARTDGEGRFRFAGLAPGTYRVRAFAGMPGAAAGPADEGIPLEVEGSRDDLEIELPAAPAPGR